MCPLLFNSDSGVFVVFLQNMRNPIEIAELHPRIATQPLAKHAFVNWTIGSHAHMQNCTYDMKQFMSCSISIWSSFLKMCYYFPTKTPKGCFNDFHILKSLSFNLARKSANTSKTLHLNHKQHRYIIQASLYGMRMTGNFLYLRKFAYFSSCLSCHQFISHISIVMGYIRSTVNITKGRPYSENI